MATERIIIEITERGARAVRRDIDALGDSAQKADGAVRLLNRALGLIASGLVLNQLIQLTDTFTNMQNRLKLVTSGTENLSRVTEELFLAANRSRSSFEATAQLYSRVALSAANLGFSQQDLINFTESLNQAVILSGASLREAEGAIIQLSQGLASGTLQGDELRSVLEQLPLVADVVGKYLENFGGEAGDSFRELTAGGDTARGALRKLGAEGLLTGEIVLNAFKDAREELDERFAQTVPTIGQSLQVLQNNFLKLFGEFATSSGLAQGLAQALFFVADNLENIIPLALAAAAAFAGWSALSTISAVLGPMIALERALGAATTNAALLSLALKSVQRVVFGLTAAIAANPLGALLVGIAAASTLLAIFADDIKVSEDGVLSLADVSVAAFQIIGESLEDVTSFFVSAWSTAVSVVDELLAAFGTNAAAVMAAIIAVAKGVVNGFIGAWRLAFRVLDEGFSGFGDAAAEAFGTDYVGEFLNKVEKRARENVAARDAIGQLDPAKPKFKPRPGGAEEEADPETYKESRDYLAEFLSEVDREIKLLGVSSREREKLAKVLQLEDNLKRELTKSERELVDARLAGLTAAEDRQIFAQSIQDIEDETTLLGLNKREREQRVRIMFIERDLGRALSETEWLIAQGLVAANTAARDQNEVLENLRGPMEDIIAQQQAWNDLLAQGRVTAEEFSLAMINLRLEEIGAKIQSGSGSLADGFIFELGRMTEAARIFEATSGAIFGQFFSDLSRGIGDSLAQAIVFSKNLGDALGNVARQAVAGLISSLVQLGIQFLINAALTRALGQAATTSSAAQATALAAAWAPAAALASLATLGANAAPAAAAVATTVALTSALAAVTSSVGFAGSFADGGLVDGRGGPRDDANVIRVSDGEFVVNAAATKRYRPQLEAINSGRGGGGSGGGSGGYRDLNISVAVDARGTSEPGAVGREVELAVIKAARQAARLEITEARRPGGQLAGGGMTG